MTPPTATAPTSASLALRSELIAEARRRGFAAAGVAGLRPFRQARERALDAVHAGRMEGMPWYTEQRVEAAATLGARYPWARSLLALAWPYGPAVRCGTAPPVTPGARGRPRGRVSAYACLPGAAGTPADYHGVLADACDALVAWLRLHVGAAVRAKRFIDHGWSLDRAVAERAGLGFCGKNACLITTQAGSYVMLAEVLLDLELPATPRSRRGCGSCRRCLPACPTGAIVAPGVIDSRRCISYLTIEHRGPIDPELRPLMGAWVFGCDLCQEACPINARLAPRPAAEPATTPAVARRGPVPFPDLVDLLELDEGAFAERFAGTAILRTGRAGLARNAAIALGNAGDTAALAALERARREDPDEVVREAAAWAAERLTAG